MSIQTKTRPAGTKKVVQPHDRCFSFLRRLHASGRSNMYGAIPYLMRAFALDRESAFRIVCEWVDLQASNASSPPKHQ
jgi:hypothetical protein